MKKRQFLTAAALAGGVLPTLLPAASQAAARTARGPALLTLTGAIGNVNRGRFDPVLDQMMHKQKLSFDKAHAFDFDALALLPAISIKPTLEYDAKAHALRGPALLDVLKAAGAAVREDSQLVLRAVDGYAVSLSVAQARAQGFIVATHLDGQPMALGGLGPLWAVYDADRVAQMAAKPLAQRFASCPWALYHIEVPA
ncbi:MAG TPA: molybdopterin-dependent oxidoreductase [Janthinobacterium sp.]|nr:molybdopterin-dependent oxidoreductase [Janthinobacterium sp.]